jgi:hypothetical protein
LQNATVFGDRFGCRFFPGCPAVGWGIGASLPMPDTAPTLSGQLPLGARWHFRDIRADAGRAGADLRNGRIQLGLATAGDDHLSPGCAAYTN